MSENLSGTVAPAQSFDVTPSLYLGTIELTDIGPYGKSTAITCASTKTRLVFVPIVVGLQMRPAPQTHIPAYSIFFNQADNVGTVLVTTPGHIDWIKFRVLAFSPNETLPASTNKE